MDITIIYLSCHIIVLSNVAEIFVLGVFVSSTGAVSSAGG
jgi:hypothetical protein